jgi:hypothetical protein
MPLTIEEYMDPDRFPLTTQKGLSPKNQLFLDAFKYDGMRQEVEEEGRKPDDHFRQVWAELEVKVKDIPRLAAEEAAKEKKPPGSG